MANNSATIVLQWCTLLFTHIIWVLAVVLAVANIYILSDNFGRIPYFYEPKSYESHVNGCRDPWNNTFSTWDCDHKQLWSRSWSWCQVQGQEIAYLVMPRKVNKVPIYYEKMDNIDSMLTQCHIHKILKIYLEVTFS